MNGRRCLRLLALLAFLVAGSDGTEIETASLGRGSSSDYTFNIGFRIEHGCPWRTWKLYASVLLAPESENPSDKAEESGPILQSVGVELGIADLVRIAGGVPSLEGWATVVHVTPSRGVL